MSQSEQDVRGTSGQEVWPPATTIGQSEPAQTRSPLRNVLGLRSFPILSIVLGITSLLVVPFTFLPVLLWDTGKLHYFCGNPRLEDQFTFQISGIGPIAAAFFAPKTPITTRDSWAKGIGIVSVVLFFALAIVDVVIFPH